MQLTAAAVTPPAEHAAGVAAADAGVIQENKINKSKDLLLRNLTVLTLFFFNITQSQTFESDIIFEDIVPNQVNKTSPAINIDSLGKIGISWITRDASFDHINFIKSKQIYFYFNIF